jgi:DNA-directed RNA polymerase subunit K/omega
VLYLPPGTPTFEFVIVTTLRTKQLMRGCAPRVTPLAKLTSTAAAEVLAGKVAKEAAAPASAPGTVAGVA